MRLIVTESKSKLWCQGKGLSLEGSLISGARHEVQGLLEHEETVDGKGSKKVRSSQEIRERLLPGSRRATAKR